MGNLLKMDLYRMRKAKSYWVCLILAFVFALAQTPFVWALDMISRMLSSEPSVFSKTADLTQIISNPFPMLNAMLCMLSVCSFFYADVENGYIKNIAGQMPKRGFTVLSKFLAVIPHNLLFMLIGVVGNLLGTIIFQRITLEGNLLESVVSFLMKFLLMQSLCSILLLVAGCFQSKSLGTVLAVLMGMGLLSLVYMGIDEALNQVWRNRGFTISSYMPDQLLGDANPKVFVSIIASAVTTAIFLPLGIRVFDKRDVK